MGVERSIEERPPRSRSGRSTSIDEVGPPTPMTSIEEAVLDMVLEVGAAPGQG